MEKQIKKIVLIGPESTGKTTLARQLAEHYKTVWVEEYAREYIKQLERPYKEKDLTEIAKGQIQKEEQKLSKANHYLFCDTDLLVLKIWSINSYQKCDDWILEQIQHRHYDLYFLCGIDTPWEYDPQREHPDLRDYLYGFYKKELQQLGKNFVEIEGNQKSRLEKAIYIINSLYLNL